MLHAPKDSCQNWGKLMSQFMKQVCSIDKYGLLPVRNLKTLKFLQWRVTSARLGRSFGCHNCMINGCRNGKIGREFGAAAWLLDCPTYFFFRRPPLSLHHCPKYCHDGWWTHHDSWCKDDVTHFMPRGKIEYFMHRGMLCQNASPI